MIKRDFSVPIYYAREMFPDCATRHYCYLLPFRNLKKNVLSCFLFPLQPGSVYMRYYYFVKKSFVCFNLQIL